MWAETTETLERSDFQKCQERERRNYCLGKQIILCFGMNLKGFMFVLLVIIKKKKKEETIFVKLFICNPQLHINQLT